MTLNFKPNTNPTFASAAVSRASDPTTADCSTTLPASPANKKPGAIKSHVFGGKLAPLKTALPKQTLKVENGNTQIASPKKFATKFSAAFEVVALSSIPPAEITAAVATKHFNSIHEKTEQQLAKLEHAWFDLSKLLPDQRDLFTVQVHLIKQLGHQIQYFKNRLPEKNLTLDSSTSQTLPAISYGSFEQIEISGVNLADAEQICDRFSSRVNEFLPTTH